MALEKEFAQNGVTSISGTEQFVATRATFERLHFFLGVLSLENGNQTIWPALYVIAQFTTRKVAIFAVHDGQNWPDNMLWYCGAFNYGLRLRLPK